MVQNYVFKKSSFFSSFQLGSIFVFIDSYMIYIVCLLFHNVKCIGIHVHDQIGTTHIYRQHLIPNYDHMFPSNVSLCHLSYHTTKSSIGDVLSLPLVSVQYV